MNPQLPILLLIPDTSPEVAADLDLPPPKENLFQRLIRNPHPNSDTPKERECTEMLAAVLLNTSDLRTDLLSWMGSLVGLDEDYWASDDYTLQIRTEQSIGSKRDDLRIEAWRLQDDEEILEVLWTVEVKVGASIHLSSYQDLEEDSEEDATEEVSQLINYDLWLQQQAARNPSAHVAGFVLALGDMGAHLPPDLSSEWACITWTQIGQLLEELLRDDLLPEKDAFLGRHMVGFVRKHLWRDVEMSDPRIEFDDIALIKAFASIGMDCGRKVNDLVAPLESILREMIDGVDSVTHQKGLFRATGYSAVYASLPDSQQPYICAGINAATICVWIEVSPNNQSRPGCVAAVEAAFPSLAQRNGGWVVDTDDTYNLLSLSEPLHGILTVADQSAAIQKMVRKAFEDLNKAGVISALKENLSGNNATG